MFASLSGNNSTNADAVGTSDNFVQQWSGEGATQSYGAMRTASATPAGTPIDDAPGMNVRFPTDKPPPGWKDG